MSIKQLIEISVNGDRTTVRFLDQRLLNNHHMEELADELTRIADKVGTGVLGLDFRDVEYVQSSALGKLVSLEKRLTSAGGRLVLCNVKGAVLGTFGVTGLDKLFTFDQSDTANSQ